MEVIKNCCSKCGKECKDKRGVSIHEAKCGKTKAPICPHCNEKFSCLASLHNHIDRCKVFKQQIIEKEQKQKEESIRQEYESRIKMIKNECEQTIQNINQSVSSRTSNIHSELINKIMTLDKETEEGIRARILEEKDKWMDKYNTDIKTRDDRISKLEEENQFLRTVVGKLGLLSESADTSNKEDEIFQYTGIKPMEYVYIIQEREFVKEGRPLYKIGRTSQKPYQRYSSYPKGSIEFMCMSVSNSKIAEGVIKKLFMSKFKQDRIIGVEYFEGDVEEMKKEFMSLIDIINQKSSTN